MAKICEICVYGTLFVYYVHLFNLLFFNSYMNYIFILLSVVVFVIIFKPSLKMICLQNSAKSEQRSVLTLGSFCLPFCVRGFLKNINLLNLTYFLPLKSKKYWYLIRRLQFSFLKKLDWTYNKNNNNNNIYLQL